MAYRKGPENLSLTQETPSGGLMTEGEAKRSGAERIKVSRENAWKAMVGVGRRALDVGKKFIGSFDRVAGKGLEGAEATGRGIKKGAEAFGSAAQTVGEVPDWILEKAGEGLNVAQEKGTAALKATGRGIKTGAEIGVGLGVAAAVGTYEAGKRGAEKLGEMGDAAQMAVYRKSMETANWMDSKATDTKQYVGQKYEGLKAWAGEKSGEIQAKAVQCRERFSQGVESVKNWKNQAMEAFHQKRIEAHFAKLSPETRNAMAGRLQELQGAANLSESIAA